MSVSADAAARLRRLASAITSLEEVRRGYEHDFSANDCSFVPARTDLICSPPQTGTDVRWSIGTNKATSIRIVNPMDVQMTSGKIDMRDVPDALPVLGRCSDIRPLLQRAETEGDEMFTHEKSLLFYYTI
jgi:hypothetical protein